jgi:alanine racemase
MASETARGVLTIDLDALVGNWRRLGRLAPGSEVAAVVKADAYGLGAAPVAAALWQTGCRSFFVAQPDEAVALRAVLPDVALYVLHGLAAGTEAALAEARAAPVLNDPAEIARWAALARRLGRRLPAALQLDTGMCRLGLSARQLARLDEPALAGLELRLVLSHLACAEDPAHPLNELQRARFEAGRKHLPAAPASLANSSGIFLGQAYQYQLCRPGVALYGVNPTPGRPNLMAAVVTLAAPILQLHEVDAAGTVGYGATCPIAPGARIATLPVGYADGYLRAAGAGAMARIGGRLVPFAGRVSMDLITLDVSALPAEAARPGTMAELIFGPDGVDAVAARAGTIGYEVLTRLGRRFARRYIRPEPRDGAA